MIRSVDTLTFVFKIILDNYTKNISEIDIDRILAFENQELQISTLDNNELIKSYLIIFKYIYEKDGKYFINNEIIKKDLERLKKVVEKNQKVQKFADLYYKTILLTSDKVDNNIEIEPLPTTTIDKTTEGKNAVTKPYKQSLEDKMRAFIILYTREGGIRIDYNNMKSTLGVAFLYGENSVKEAYNNIVKSGWIIGNDNMPIIIIPLSNQEQDAFLQQFSESDIRSIRKWVKAYKGPIVGDNQNLANKYNLNIDTFLELFLIKYYKAGNNELNLGDLYRTINYVVLYDIGDIQAACNRLINKGWLVGDNLIKKVIIPYNEIEQNELLARLNTKENDMVDELIKLCKGPKEPSFIIPSKR